MQDSNDEKKVELKTDPEREGIAKKTGIFIRAKGSNGKWDSFDIAELDTTSLKAWLRSRGGENIWAENVVLVLLDHEEW
jgi:hypothetical protein